jgi:hypothetical protein
MRRCGSHLKPCDINRLGLFRGGEEGVKRGPGETDEGLPDGHADRYSHVYIEEMRRWRDGPRSRVARARPLSVGQPSANRPNSPAANPIHPPKSVQRRRPSARHHVTAHGTCTRALGSLSSAVANQANQQPVCSSAARPTQRLRQPTPESRRWPAQKPIARHVPCPEKFDIHKGIGHN